MSHPTQVDNDPIASLRRLFVWGMIIASGPAAARAADALPDPPPSRPPTSRPDGEKGGGPHARTGSLIEKIRSVLGTIDLSAEQKAKTDAAFETARRGMEVSNTSGANGPRAAEKITDTLRQDVEAALTDDQKKTFRTEMARGSGDPGSAKGGPITTLREQLRQVDLTVEQQDKVQDLVLEMREKIGIAARGQTDREQNRGEKIRQISDEYRQKIIALLDPGQKAKLDQLNASQHRGKPSSRGG